MYLSVWLCDKVTNALVKTKYYSIILDLKMLKCIIQRSQLLSPSTQLLITRQNSMFRGSFDRDSVISKGEFKRIYLKSVFKILVW